MAKQTHCHFSIEMLFKVKRKKGKKKNKKQKQPTTSSIIILDYISCDRLSGLPGQFSGEYERGMSHDVFMRLQEY